MATLFGFQPASGSYVSNEDLQTSTRVKAWRGTVDATLELPDLGVVTSITGYRDVRYNTELDTDATPFTIVQFPGNRQSGRQFSQELRFASTFSESFEFVVGGYYSSYDLYVLERRNFSGLLLNRSHSQIASFQGITDQIQKTAAAFGNLTWHATSRLSLTAGARYNWERKTVEIAPIRLCPGSFDTCATIRTTGKKSWTDISPRFAVDFQANDDLLLYASYTKGFRSGAFNSRATVAAAIGPSAPESVASLEAGIKSSWFDNLLKVNIAGFHVKYDEIQRTITPPGTTFSQLTNAGDALVDGLEMEVVLKPMRGLELNASLGYLDARYKRFVGLPAGTPPVNELEFPQVPKYTYALNGSYSFSIDGISPKFRASATYSHRSGAYLDSLNPRQSLLEGYGKLDASFSVSTEHFTITAFGRNIADKRYFDYVSTLTAGPLFEYVRYGGSPATYGVELSVKL